MLPLRAQERPDADELAAWRLVRSVDPAGDLPELTAARILNRVLAPAVPLPRSHPRWLVAMAAVALTLLGLQVAAAAIVTSIPSLRRSLRMVVARTAGHGSAPEAASQASTCIAPVPTTPVPAAMAGPVLVPAAAASQMAVNHSASRRRAPQIAAIAARDDAEAKVMESAARQLYADHDPTAALATLEPYLYLHPEGSLRPEMVVAAVQANLLLERTPEALGLLEGMAAEDFKGIPRASELRLLRAELLARDHRCREAAPVFEQMLGATEVQQRERALYGRAVCRAQASDVDGSRADLRAYLRQYPSGRFSAEARRAVGESP
jgi:hypothetical protein